MNRKTKLCIIIVILLIAASLLAIAAINHRSAKGTIAEIIQDGKCIKTIDLSQVTQPYEFTVTWENNSSNTIRVEPGKIAVVAASCPDKICMETGYISDSLKPITCLPNHLIIRIQNKKTGTLDGISG